MSKRAGTAGGHTTSAQVVELDSALWRRLLVGSDDDEVFFESWLALQARQLRRAVNAVLVVLDQDGQMRPVSYWPKGTAPGLNVIKVAQSAVRRRIGIVRRLDADESEDEAICSFAYPVIIEDDVAAVAAFNLSDATEQELQSSLRRVQWGAVWLENHFRQQRAGIVTGTAERLSASLDLVAVALEHESAAPAALALMTETAVRLGSERASIGFRHRLSCRVMAISHTSEISQRQNLVRGIAAAMDEAIDQQKIIVFPAAKEDYAVTVKHRELSQR